MRTSPGTSKTAEVSRSGVVSLLTPLGLEKIKPAYEAFRAEASVRAVPDWLLELRQNGEDRVLANGLPTRAIEAWKYTNLALLLEGEWAIAESFSDDELPARDLFPVYDGDKSGEIVLLNGCLIPQWSSDASDRVIVRTSNEVEALTWLAGRSPIQESFNASFLRDVIVIDIKPGTIFKEPLVISTFSFGSESLNKWSASAPRLVINVGAGCEIALVEMSGGDGRTVNLAVTSIMLAKGARLSHVRLNMNQDAGVQLASTQISLSRDSFCETYQFTLSGRLSREDLNIQLTEPGAEASLDGLYLVSGQRHVDHSTNVEHMAPQTTSSQLYKGILNDDGRAVFNGRVHIHRDAQKSTASQLNNNLILSKRAEIDTKPELEIDADDVKASHGATIGQIDPEHVFYLRARAIHEAEAIKMLAKGFAQDIAFRITNDVLRRAVEKIVQTALTRSEASNG